MLSPHINIQRPSTDLGAGKLSDAKLGQQKKSSNSPSSAVLTPHSPQHETSTGKRLSTGSYNVPTVQISSMGLPTARDGAITIQWKEKSMEKAPELNIMTKNPAAFHVYSGDCFSKVIRLISSFCKNLSQVNHSTLANFKPVEGRTDHTLLYVNDLAREYLINLRYGSQTRLNTVVKTPSGTSIRSHLSKTSKMSSTSSTREKRRAEQAIKNSYLKEFYERSYRTLTLLQQSINHFKTIIYTLTFSRYAENELTESEAKAVRGKSMVGGCVWVVALALQQLQEDPEMEQLQNSPKSSGEIAELASELQALVNLSIQTWRELLFAITVVEKVYQKTEEVFQKQTTLFFSKAKPESEAANVASLHNREFRRQPDNDLEQLKHSKGFDPYATLLTWNNKRHAPSRLMYITEYTDLENPWHGFDPLPVNKKILYLRELMNFAKLILESVKESVQKIITDLQGHATQDKLAPLNPRYVNNARQPPNVTGITSYEEGIEVMEELLTKKFANIEWNSTEIHEFFETDKIFLDDMDLLALGAAVSRAILFDARHTMHVCYETCKLLDYKEFAHLPEYRRLYLKVKETVSEEHLQNRVTQGKKGTKNLSRSSQFDIGKNLLELRNVGALFRTSHYREIVRDLPLYTNRLGMTLQDAEMVFTLSSEKLLS